MASTNIQFGNRSEHNSWEWSGHHQTAVDESSRAVEPYVHQPSWLNYYPLMWRLQTGHNLNEDEVALVNIAGGRGHDCAAIRARFPVLPGRMVLQDSVDNIAHAVPVKGMNVMEHSIFHPQPIIGARIYLMRNVLFTYSDFHCLQILKIIISAMVINHSLLVINEPVVLDQNANFRSTQIDPSLTSYRFTLTRTTKDWTRLLASAGLKILGIWDGVIIEASLPELKTAVR